MLYSKHSQVCRINFDLYRVYRFTRRDEYADRKRRTYAGNATGPLWLVDPFPGNGIINYLHYFQDEGNSTILQQPTV